MLRNKLDFKEDEYISQEIVLHITRGLEYAKFSPIEKFKYVDKMMKLSRDYYCNMFNINKYKVGTYFVYGFHGGGCRLEEDKEGYSSFGVTIDKVLKSDNPLDLFRTCAHEMRHIYQCLKLDKTHPENNRNYSFDIDEISNFLWYSSNTENMADKFSFEEALRFGKKGVLKFDEGRVSLLDLFNLKVDSMQSRVKHIASKTAYDVLDNFKVFSKKEDYSNGKTEVNVFTLKKIETLAEEVPEVMYQECKKGSIEDNTLDVAKDVMDLFEKYVEYLEQEENCTKEDLESNLVNCDVNDGIVNELNFLRHNVCLQKNNLMTGLNNENCLEE